jgi:hypothetical protein
VNNSFRLSEEIRSGEIYNMVGQKIKTFSENNKEFNVSNLKKGLYFFKTILTNGSNHMFRFTKN